MTREEKRQRRRENLLMALCICIIGVWVAALLCSMANAAYAAEVVEQELDPLTEVLAIIGSGWVSWTLMRFIKWLDTPRRRTRG